MYLTIEEERALNGEYGPSLETAYRILVAIGKLTDAPNLIPISSAHVSGVSYSTIGEFGEEFLKSFSQDAKVSVPTTVNPCGVDLQNWSKMVHDQEFVRHQFAIVEAYKRMGVVDSYSCIPYEGLNEPPKGSHVAWAETSAAIYANSILGLRTNRESSLSALASAITGKTPKSGLHLDELRKPKLVVRVRTALSGSLGFGLLGYFAGKLTDGPIGFQGVERLSKADAKALSAAIGTSGSSGIFIPRANTEGLETVDFTEKEKVTIFDELNEVEDGQGIVFGCPQLTLDEVTELARRAADRRFTKPCLIFCSRSVYQRASKAGFVKALEGAGASFICDACADFSPVVSWMNLSSVVTDTCKGAHYMKRVSKARICLKSTEDILKKYCT